VYESYDYVDGRLRPPLRHDEEVTLRTVSFDFESPEAQFKILVNHEEQYSLWPADLDVPGGWSETGMCTSKEECDKWLEENWTDMRPKSLRVALDGE
jgi:MbtH protein